MLSRRIAYGMVLVAAVLFQICFVDYFSHFLLVLVLFFPFFSLALSLPGLLGLSLSISPRSAAVERGGTGQWDIRLENKTRLPLARLLLELETGNALTGEKGRIKRAIPVASSGRTLHETADTGHCGQLTCTAARARAVDLMGLFSLPVKIHSSAGMLVLPQRIESFPLPQFAGGKHDGVGVKPRPGGGPGEDYDLRPYRPGDPMRSVHWKLSSKLDDLVVRETLEPRRAVLVLTYDHIGPPARLDTVLDRLCGASRTLLAQERPHYIQWLEPASGALRCHHVTTERDLTDVLSRCLCAYAPRDGKSILDLPIRVTGEDGPVRHLHLTAEGASAKSQQAVGAEEGGAL